MENDEYHDKLFNNKELLVSCIFFNGEKFEITIEYDVGFIKSFPLWGNMRRDYEFKNLKEAYHYLVENNYKDRIKMYEYLLSLIDTKCLNQRRELSFLNNKTRKLK